MTSLRPRAVLFDADGVIQRPTADRQTQWRALVGGAENAVGPFKIDIFTAERPCHDGQGDFIAALREVLTRWNCTGTVDDARRAWTASETDSRITELISAVRAAGTPCHLATNQEPYRARYMTDVLGYAAQFDRLFFSCELGCSKPDARYFRRILHALDLSAPTVLFIDDTPANVAAASELGIRAELFAPRSDSDVVEDMRGILVRNGLLAVEALNGR
jgi:putative hydrolase of the HAD superfamily